MIKNKMNKKGGDKIISVYCFVILFLVAAAVSYMVISFYGKPYDVRGLEANILTNRIADCVSENGYIKEETLTREFGNEFLEKCKLNFEAENIHDWQSQEQYYAQVEVIGFNSNAKISEFSAGNVNLKNFCETKGKYMPLCLQRSFYSIDKNNTQYQVNILSIVKKVEKNVK